MREIENVSVSRIEAVAPLVVAPRHGESYKESLEGQSHSASFTRRTPKRKRAVLPRGLWNAGQTCHLGASVTALSAASCLRAWLRNKRVEQGSVHETIRHSLLEASASSERHGLDPRPLLTILEHSGWKSRHAQDAHETMARILEFIECWSRGFSAGGKATKGLTMHDEHHTTLRTCGKLELSQQNRSSMMPFSIVTAAFQQCCNCGHKSELSVQRGTTVTLPIPSSVQSLSSLFISSQITKEVVEMQCYTCRRYGKHLRNTDIKRLPDLLIIHLHNAVFTSGYTKTAEGRAIIPVQMEIPEGRPIRGTLRTRKYFLRSVVRHWGGNGGQFGHFDSVIRQDRHQGFASLSGEATWWQVDDDRVQMTTTEQACQTHRAYLVLYERQKYASS